MHKFRWLMVFFLTVICFSKVPHGTAQDDAAQFGADDLSSAVRSQELDSYWLDQKKWMAYGYRPHIQANLAPFTNLPSYTANKNYYSYGTDLPAPSLENPYDKASVQLTKYGTWH